MTEKELLRGEIRETIRLYRLGLNKKTLEALVDDMEAIFKQEIKRVVKGISAGAILEAQGRKECGDSPYTYGINKGIDETIDVLKLRITYTDNFLKGIDKVLKTYEYIEKQKIKIDKLKAQQRRKVGIK